MYVAKWIFPFFGLFGGTLAAAEPADRFTSFAGFELESSATLADVVKTFGPAELIESGEAGEYEALVCYTTPGVVYGFLSSEMGGPRHTLLGFSLAVPRASHHSQCSLLSGSTTALATNVGGLFIGMTRAQFESLLGAGITWKNEKGGKSFVFTTPMSDDEVARARQTWPDVTDRPYFDVIVSVEGRFDGDVLIEVHVWKVKTL